MCLIGVLGHWPKSCDAVAFRRELRERLAAGLLVW